MGLAAGRGVVESLLGLAGLGSEGAACATGGETEEERIRADIVENQVMDNRMQLIMLCYNPDFVSGQWVEEAGFAAGVQVCIQIVAPSFSNELCYSFSEISNLLAERSSSPGRPITSTL